MIVAVDAMGGDHAPAEVVRGAVAAARELGVEVILVGDEAAVRRELASCGRCPKVRVHPASQFVAMNESPTSALRKKPDASVLVAARLVKEGRAQALVSAGNTGALMEGSLLVLGRVRGIKRPAIATLWPSLGRVSLLLDSGANADTRPEYLVQFALMGSLYVEKILGVPRPRVGLLNIGEEPGKGSALVQEAHQLLAHAPVHFAGNVEMKDFLAGRVEVGVADGFVGNMILKTAEGVAELIMSLLKEEIGASTRARIGAAFLRPVFRKLRQKLDHTEYGGAPFLGLNGVCIKSHGRARARAIRNAVGVAVRAVESGLVECIAREVGRLAPVRAAAGGSAAEN